MASFFETTYNQIFYYRSTNLKEIRHGFSTRIGGVSTDPALKSMNLGFQTGDVRSNVIENYQRFCSVLPINPLTIVTAEQIHSNTVRYVTRTDCGSSIPTCDALVTDLPNVALCIRTADCVPILFYDPIHHVIGAAHAGWRGTIGRIATACVDEMVAHGAEKKEIQVAMGASIGPCCYTVRDDFCEAVTDALGETIAQKFIKLKCADLKGINEFLLLECGIAPKHMSVSKKCTCCEPDLFFSHRASGGKRGILASILSM